MGLAASQARLLMLTARIHDVEYQAQMIQNAKLQLAIKEDEVYRKYNEALDATTLTFTTDTGAIVPASFNNLCGPASVDNGLNKNYVFRTGDNDRLIVPSEVYNGYEEYGGDDPYAFAMFMLGISSEALAEAEEIYASTRAANGSSDSLSTIRQNMNEKLEAIAKARNFDPDSVKKHVLGGGGEGGESVESLLPDENDSNYDNVKKLIDDYKELEDEYRYKLYQKNGAQSIFCEATKQDKEDFDQKLFDYYLKWGMLIEQEVGIDACIREDDYSAGFGNDTELLNQMLQSGKIMVDVVSIDRKGKMTDEYTSVATESSLNFTNTSSIDKKALAKAEAEYEHEMKKIDRQDKQYDTDLNKLETERTALTTEYDSVKKVIQDNVERTFGIFS